MADHNGNFANPDAVVDIGWAAEHRNDPGVAWSRSTSTPPPTTRATSPAPWAGTGSATSRTPPSATWPPRGPGEPARPERDHPPRPPSSSTATNTTGFAAYAYWTLSTTATTTSS